jgi:hypothetical protein
MVERLEAFEGRFRKKILTTIVRHPVHWSRRSASFYLRPIKTTKAVYGAFQQDAAEDGGLGELRAGIEQMELPASVG